MTHEVWRWSYQMVERSKQTWRQNNSRREPTIFERRWTTLFDILIYSVLFLFGQLVIQSSSLKLIVLTLLLPYFTHLKFIKITFCASIVVCLQLFYSTTLGFLRLSWHKLKIFPYTGDGSQDTGSSTTTAVVPSFSLLLFLLIPD